MKPPPLLERKSGTPPSSQQSPIFKPIAAELAQVDSVLREELYSRYPFVNELVDHITAYQGKRLRSSLLLLVGKATGNLCPSHSLLAAVVEMIHTATLVHDDVLDQAVVRRHRATVNAEWGTETSVLLGDYLFTHAFHLASSLDSTLACRLIGRATNIVCEGELHQIYHRGQLELSEQEYLEIIEGKTAELCAVCSQLGAHFAGASSAVEHSMDRFGRNLGMAFQIADDLLDLLGEEGRVGKSLGTDLEQRKLTLPLIWLLQNTSADMARAARRVLSNQDSNSLAELRPILEQSGAIDYAQRQAARFAASALEELCDLDDSPAKQSLEKLTHFVVNRSA